MASGILDTIKSAAVGAVEHNNPVNIVYGTVIKDKPLEIKLDNSITLKQEDKILKLAQNVTEHKIKVKMQWNTTSVGGGSGEAAFTSHAHAVSGEKEITIMNALKTGEKVILARLQGGQSYLVLDRLEVKK